MNKLESEKLYCVLLIMGMPLYNVTGVENGGMTVTNWIATWLEIWMVNTYLIIVPNVTVLTIL